MAADGPNDARAAAELAARVSYGRLLAIVARRTRDIAAAEDALSEAFRAALETWPVRGVPANPDAWLVTAARRQAGHAVRHDKVAQAAVAAIDLLHAEAQERADTSLPDERLKLMFICAHPAIDASIRTPLMLQTVLGLDAVRIARAFLVAPATMGQRLARAKAKIRDAGMAFQNPDRTELPERLEAVLSAIYAAYGTGWEDALGADAKIADLSGEALFLVRLIVGLLPDEPEARGLLALILYCEARRPARRAGGRFVPLAEQDARLWSTGSIIAAEGELVSAARSGVFGRFQTEAAIQSVHCQRALTGVTNWQALATLYDLLAVRAPAIGNLIARAAVHGERDGPAAGLALLDALPREEIAAYQPYWATRASLLSKTGDFTGAAAAYANAIGLTQDVAVRAFLASRKAAAASLAQ
jgi:RNA polymerase sigma-70 factor (ECF subfamily)